MNEFKGKMRKYEYVEVKSEHRVQRKAKNRIKSMNIKMSVQIEFCYFFR